MDGQVDEHVIRVLRQSKKPLTAYEIAKKLNITWPTVNKHCLTLLIEGKLHKKIESSISGKKTLWGVK
jgi:predicted transcriptional regulator